MSTESTEDRPKRRPSRLRLGVTLLLVAVVVFCLFSFVRVWRCPPLCVGSNITGRDFRNREIGLGVFTNVVAKGVDFSGATLNNLTFAGSDLSGASFEGAKMLQIDLNGADLIGANLTGANLSAATFEAADLRGANFTGAILTGVDLTQTQL